jgi:hypothetical protein
MPISRMDRFSLNLYGQSFDLLVSKGHCENPAKDPPHASRINGSSSGSTKVDLG